ncbi:MAG TPA: tyrosine-type recombinase/integrase [Pyrinomonadaceae bacterium]
MTEEKQTRKRGQVIPLDNPDPKRATSFKVRVPKKNAKGERRYHNATLHNSTEAKAWKYVTKILGQVDDGSFFEPSTESVEQLLKRWLKHVERQSLKTTTLDTYRDYARFYLNPALGHVPLAQLTPLVVQDAFDALVDRGLAPLTIRSARRILKRALAKAVKWGKLKDNPAADIETPKARRNNHRAWTEEEAGAFLTAAKVNPDDLIFILVLCTGLRPAEFLGLQWTDLELVQDVRSQDGPTVERGLLRVQHNLVRPRGGGWLFTDPKTEKGARDIYFPVTLYHELMKLKARQSEQKKQMGVTYHDHGLVFACDNGKPLDRGWLSITRFKPLLRRAGLSEEFSFYTLRRSFATLATAAGASRLGRSMQMGHADPDFTDEVYVTVLPSMKKSASDALENLLLGESRTLFAPKEPERVM